MKKGWIILSLFIPFSLFGQSVLLPEDDLTMGCYRLLWQELKQRIPTLKGSFFPHSRVNNLFLESDFDCTFPFAGEVGLDIFRIESKTVVMSKPLNHLGVYVLTSEQESHSLAEITNDRSTRVAAILGLEELLQDWQGQIYWVGEMKQVLRMIGLNRVNYIVVTFPDAYADFRKSKLNIAAVLTLSTDNFVCKKNDVGMSTVNKINEVIEDMKTDGTLEKKLGDCYFSPEMVPVP